MSAWCTLAKRLRGGVGVETDRKRQKETETDRQTDRETDREIETEVGMGRCYLFVIKIFTSKPHRCQNYQIPFL